MAKPATLDGYSDQYTVDCERVLVTLLRGLGPWKDSVYLVGGLTPRYLVAARPPVVPAHAGTLDVDERGVGVAGGQQRALPRRQRAVLPALTRWPALITRQVARVGSILHRRRLTRQGGRSLHLQQRPGIVNQWLHGRVVPAFLQDGQPQRPHGRAK